MRVKLQLVIYHDDGHEETVTDVITLNKNNQRLEHLGLSLAESKQLLGTLQRHLLQQQVNTSLDTHSTCPDCSSKPAAACEYFATRLSPITTGTLPTLARSSPPFRRELA